MRTGFSARMQQYMYGSNTSEVLATCMQLHHPNQAIDFCIVNKASAINANKVNPTTGALVPGQVFQAAGFNCPLPSELTGTLPTLTFQIDNTDLNAGYWLLPTAGGGIKPDVWLSCVLLSDTNTPQFGPCHFKAGPVAINRKLCEITLSFEDTLTEMFPVPGITPFAFPAVFGNLIQT